MDDFISVTEKDPQIRNKINNILDRYIRLPYKYQSKIGYDSLFQNVILKKLINIIGSTIIDIDIDLKLENSKIKCLEKKVFI